MQFRLRPGCGLEIENNDVVEVLAVFVLPAKNQQFISSPKVGGMP
jgi:hypothetical protein